jgi:hypothetical protein
VSVFFTFANCVDDCSVHEPREFLSFDGRERLGLLELFQGACEELSMEMFSLVPTVS